jgi:hypothetical protein
VSAGQIWGVTILFHPFFVILIIFDSQKYGDLKDLST